MTDLHQMKCVACSGGEPVLTDEEIAALDDQEQSGEQQHQVREHDEPESNHFSTPGQQRNRMAQSRGAFT